MRALVLLSALSLVGCAHQQVRDDRPIDGAGGGVGLDAPAVATRVMLAGGMGVGGLKSINGGPNEHAGQDMLAKSITLSAASGANAVGVTTDNARIDLGTGGSDYLYSNGSTINTPGVIVATNGYSTSSAYQIGGGNVLTASLMRIATPAALPTCSSSTLGQFSHDSTGGSGAVYTKICVCRFDGTTYKWFNAFNPSVTTGTTTTCPN